MNSFQPFRVSMLSSLLLSLLMFSSTVLLAQKATNKLDEETLTLVRKPISSMDQATGAVILLKNYEVNIDKKGRKTKMIRVVGKLFNKQAVTDFSQIPIPFNSFNEDAVLDYARVIYAEGNFLEVSADAVQIKTTPDTHGGTQYTDNKYLTFTLPGLEPGITFDYRVTIREKFGIFEGAWFENHLFGNLLRSLYAPYTPRIDPVLVSRYVLNVPKGSVFRYYLTSGSLEPEKSSDNIQDHYKWEFQNIPAIQIEAAMPNIGSLCPALVVSTLKDWSELNTWAYEKLMPSVEVSNEIRELAYKLASTAKTTDEKIRSIAYYIQRNIQYVYADLNRGGFTPHMAGDILKSRYGDCKDQTILLISLLKAIGIDAYPALINPYPYEENLDIPVNNFVHLITYLPLADKELWLDMTSGVTPYPKLAFADQGRIALIINEKGGILTKTPVSNSEENVARFDLVTGFSENKTRIKINLEAAGVTSDIVKQMLLELKPDEQEEIFRVFVRTSVNNAEIDDVVLDDVHDPDKPFKARILYHIDSLWSEGQPSFNFGSHALLPLTFFTNADIRSMPTKRLQDIIVPFAFSIRGSETYVQPAEDLLPFILPEKDSLKSEFLRFKKSFLRSSDTVKANWILEVKQQQVTKTKYPLYYKDHKMLNELILWNVLYFEPLALFADVISNDTPQAILAYCRDALAKDPGNTLLMLLKGLVHEQMNMPDSSINTYSAILKNEPGNKYAHLLMSTPLFIKLKTDEAMKCLDRALQLDPDFIQAYAIRANLWKVSGDYEKALIDYDRIGQIDSQNDMVWKEKGFLLYQLRRHSEAALALQKALEKSPDDDMIHAALADSYIELGNYEKAIQSYQEAIRINPYNSDNFGNLGWAYYLVNNDQKCIEYSLKALKLDPSAYYAKYNQALANLRMGSYEEAVKLYSLLSQERSIPGNIKMGAVDDLILLMQQSNRDLEIKSILKKYFGVITN